jgi:hypothetical protein
MWNLLTLNYIAGSPNGDLSFAMHARAMALLESAR